MSNSGAAIRHKLYDYIRVGDNKKLQAIYNLLENEIEQTAEWWKNKQFVKELDKRYQDLETGVDKGITLSQLSQNIDDLRKKKYGR